MHKHQHKSESMSELKHKKYGSRATDIHVHVRAQVLVHMWLASRNEMSICALFVHRVVSSVLV